MEYTQVTLFHLLVFVAFAFGLIFGAMAGHEQFGLIGGGVGGIVGAYVASLPVMWLWRIGEKAFIRKLCLASTEDLGHKLTSPLWNLQQNIALLVLAGRGGNVASYLPRLRKMLRSDDHLIRRYGWDGVRLVFTELAKKLELEGYDPKEPTEVCRGNVDRLEDADWTLGCAKPDAASIDCPEGAI